MSKKPDLEQKDEFSDTWTAPCRDPNCGHPRYAHSGQLGDNPCKIGDCPCPWFIDFNPTGVRVGFYDSPRFWVDSADEYDPAWYQKLGVPSFGGADEWGRPIVTVRIPFVGYLHWAYRTCWCQDCHAMREQTYKYQREEWDHVTERANQDLLWTKDHRHMFLGGTFVICNNCKSNGTDPDQRHLKCPGGTWCDCGCHPREWVAEEPPKPKGHVYLSDTCFHALADPGRDYVHALCQSYCKYCQNRCVCDCHLAAADTEEKHLIEEAQR